MKRMLLLSAVFGLAGLAASAGEAANETLIPNRLATAKVGEWALYKIPDGYTQKHRVVERAGDGATAHLTIRIDNLKDGAIVSSHEVTEVAGEPMAAMPPTKEEGDTTKLRTEKAAVKGKTLELTAIEVHAKDGKLLRTWYVTPELPVYGLLKRISPDGVNDFELVDFGDQ